MAVTSMRLFFQRIPSVLGKPITQLILIALAVAVVYGQTLDVPFYLDDFLSIQKNPAIRSLNIENLWHYSAQRVVGYFTLALNYAGSRLEPAGYHLVNITIHLTTAWVLWGLVRGILTTPALQRLPTAATFSWLPLLAALIFALHPLQTQAVTYITQRLASLAALFYLSALLCYLRGRLAQHWQRRFLWWSGGLTLAAAALFTKQNTVTLPVACLLIELSFFPAPRKNQLLWGAFGVLLVIGLSSLWMMSHSDWTWMKRLDELTRETHWFNRGDYLAAQMKALWWYVRLFVFPVGLRFDYAAHHPPAWNDFDVLAAAAAHILIMAAAIRGLARYPLPAFSILFYYLTHIVESSVIPIRDLLFEHRTYLPNAGLALAMAWCLVIGLPHSFPQWRRWGQGLTCLIIALLAWLTWQRNQLWRDPIAFWQSNVALEPETYRPRLELGNSYFDVGRNDQARRVAEELVDLLDRHGWEPGEEDLPQTVVVNLALAYALVHRYDEAEKVARHYLRYPFSNESRANLLLTLGDACFARKKFPEAEEYYRQSVELYPDNPNAWLSLGETLGVQGRFEQARQVYLQLLTHWPNHPFARKKLALAEYLLQQQSHARPTPW